MTMDPKVMTRKRSRKQLAANKPLLDKITTVHGLSYLTQHNWRRLGWIAVFLGNMLFTIYLFIVIKQKFDSNQILTRVDATCRVNQVPFPSVIICNENIVSLKETKNIERILKSHGRNASEIEGFFSALYHLIHFGYGSDQVGDFTEIMDIMRRHYFTIDTIMQEVHQKCEDLLLYCTFNQKPKKCTDLFKLVKTLEGYCCAFNYAALNDGIEDSFFENDDNIEYYDDRKVGSIISTSKSGRLSGITVLFDIEAKDYPPWAKASFYGARILVSDPNDFPETTVITKYIESGNTIEVMVDPMIFRSDDNLRRVPVEQRRCLFFDEMDLAHTDRYSYETCHTECRIQTYLHDCGCVPYKYPRDKTSRLCELSDLSCLHHTKVYGSNFSCDCFLECSDKKYICTEDIIPLSVRDLPRNSTHNYNITELMGTKVFFGKATCTCYKRSLYMGLDRIIGTYGGVFSLSAGASILTIVELIYLLSSSLISTLWKRASTKDKTKH